MCELCLGIYLQILFSAKTEDPELTKTYFVAEILSLLTNDFDPSSTAMSKVFTGINNPPKSVTSKATYLTEDDYSQIVENFRKTIMPMMNTNKLPLALKMLEVAIVTDAGIQQDTEVDVITGLKKNELGGKIEDEAVFLTGVLLYVIRCTKNPGKSGILHPNMEWLCQVTPEFEFPVIEKKQQEEKKGRTTITNKQAADRYAEQIEQKAIAFCIKNESANCNNKLNIDS